MATLVKTIKSKVTDDTIYPVTKADAVYLADTDTSVEQVLLVAEDQDEPTGEVSFDSQDTELNPGSTTSVDLLQSTDSWSQRFVKISQMFKNIRYLLTTVGGLFKIVSYSGSYTCSANGAVNITGNMIGNSGYPSGYRAVAVVEYNPNSNDVIPRSINAGAYGTGSIAVLTNKSSSSVSSIFSINILYVKTSSISS